MTQQLTFEGVEPVGIITRVSGDGTRITRPLHLGEGVILIVEAEVSAVNHKSTVDGMKRIQNLAAIDFIEAADGKGRELLIAARAQAKAATDQAAGQLTIDDEIAADPEVKEYSEFTVVFDDGTQAKWPDDWGGDEAEEIFVGDFVPEVDDPEKSRRIVKLIDPATGEVVEEWDQ